MATFGQTLKRERELRSITLREVSEATKIGLRYLEAMEEGRFDQLPGGLFNKGFIRAYAKFIGLDGEALVNSYLYDTAHQEDASRTRPRYAGMSLEDPDPPVLPAAEPVAPAAPSRPRWLVPALAAAGIVLAIAVGWWLLARWADSKARAAATEAPAGQRTGELRRADPIGPSSPDPATQGGAAGAADPSSASLGVAFPGTSSQSSGAPLGPAGSVVPSPAAGFASPGAGETKMAAPASASNPPPAKAPPARAVRPLIAAFTAGRMVYLEVWCDGVQRIGRDMAAGETEQVACAGGIRVTTSNAGAVAMRIDGNDCLPLGGPDVPLPEFEVNRHKAAEFCPPAAREP